MREETRARGASRGTGRGRRHNDTELETQHVNTPPEINAEAQQAEAEKEAYKRRRAAERKRQALVQASENIIDAQRKKSIRTTHNTSLDLILAYDGEMRDEKEKAKQTKTEETDKAFYGESYCCPLSKHVS